VEAASGVEAASSVGAVVTYPEDPVELLDLADRLHRTGRAAEAAAAWRRFDGRHPPRS